MAEFLTANQRAPELHLDLHELRSSPVAVKQVLLASENSMEALLRIGEVLGTLAVVDPALAEDVAPVTAIAVSR